MTALIILVVLAALLILILVKSAVVVPNQRAYIVERLGKFHGTLTAGFHILVPFLDTVAYKRSLKEEVQDVPKQTCITKDNVTVDIDGVLYLQVIEPDKSAYGINDFRTAAIQLAQTSLRSAIGKMELDRTLQERMEINREVVEAMDKATEPWGIKVLRYEIKDITPPRSVMDSMEAQMRAEREKRAAIAQSEGTMQAQMNLAEGEKKAAVFRSEGEMQAQINRAEGQAKQIEAVAKATAEGLKMVAEQLAANGGMQAANLRVAEAYVEQFGNLAKTGTTTILPLDLANVGGMVKALTSVIMPTGNKNEIK